MRFLISCALLLCSVTSAAAEENVPKPAVIASAGFKQYLDDKDVVLVKFGATWCGPCKQAAPAAEEYAAEGRHVVTVDVDAQSDVAQRYRATSFPTYIVFRRGVEQHRHIGAILSVSGLKNFVRTGRTQ